MGAGVRVIDNEVIDTVDPGEGFAVDAIQVVNANGAVIEGNRLANQFIPPHVFGITIFDSSGVLVVNNRITNFTDGITFLDSTGKLRDNLTLAWPVPSTAARTPGTTLVPGGTDPNVRPRG